MIGAISHLRQGTRMASEGHLAYVYRGGRACNDWRNDFPGVEPDLRDADLRNINLHAADLSNALLNRAMLSSADLSRANLKNADLSGANLSQVRFIDTDLQGANLRGAYLFQTHLNRANLRGADLSDADFSGTNLQETVLGDIDLTATKCLDSCSHWGPSIVDHRTLERSKNVPLTFWRGCGLPDRLIDYLPSLVGDAIQYYSCFISYSSMDQAFADRLHADLQNKGVRCWFAPHDLPIGAKTWDGIDEAIRTRDKVLLILSEGAIASDWVADEVTTAFAEERRRKQLVLFPVRLDRAVMETKEAWAGKLRDNRNIGDFTRWKEHDAYQGTFERLLNDLKVER